MLGVDPDASRDEVLAAYRSAARRHHPDTGAADAAAMAAVAAAWRVLGDPARRMAYDNALRARPASVAPARPQPSDDGPPTAPPQPRFDPLARYQNPARFPWGLMAVMAVIGIAFVVVSVVTAGTPKEPVPDNVLQQGSCVTVLPNGDAAEVTCGRAHDGVVQRIVAFDERCPSGEIGHRDKQGLGIACIVPQP